MLRTALATLSVLAVAGGLLSVAEPASAALPKPSYDGTPSVLLNELTNGASHSDADVFFELRNWGDEPVDLTGWEVYACNYKALRAKIGLALGDLTGVVLEPGEIFTISRVGMPGDDHITQTFDLTGFGLYLEDPDDVPIDMVGVYPDEPWPTLGECTPPGGNLPNALDFAQDESWQRVAATGDPARDWIVAPATLGASNATRPAPVADTDVVISELAGAGPAGADDDFVELRNDGDVTVDLGGWQLFRCTATGRLRPSTLQLTVPAGTRLAPGDTWVAGSGAFTGDADARYATPLADREFGLLVRTADGLLVDRAAVAIHHDSACQGDVKLPATLDMARAESHQLTAAGEWVVAPRTPGRRNATRADALLDPTFGYDGRPGVAISEIATDPAPEGMPAGTVQRNFIELGNYGDEPVDVSGWTAWRCMADGARAATPQFTIDDDTVLDPGETFLAARAGTALEARADATYDTALSLLGTGVWLTDAAGDRVDSVGIYAANVLDAINITASPCTKGVALTTYQPDRLLEQTFQRSRFTGSDTDDFVVRAATPGVIDEVAWVDPTLRVEMAPDVDIPIVVEPQPLAAPEGAAVTVLEAWGGTTELGPLTTLAGERETALDPAAPGAIADDRYAYPYQRLVLDASELEAGSTVTWAGRGTGRTELQLSVWDGDAWRLLDAGTGDELHLAGELEQDDIRDGRVTVLVQNGPRTEGTLASAPDGALENPDAYDLAISHITDTQYLTESYPEVYATITSWIATNAPGRKIAFATHTGDIIQNWVDPEQTTERALREYERASAIQSILDDAGVPNSVLPGNHDNLRGGDASLFNAYFGPSRYEDEEWYGDSIAPTDNSANFSTFEEAGAKFLMLSLPYAFDDREIVWAQEVVRAHPEYNVIVSTHEHVTPDTLDGPATRSTSSRWVSRGQELWERLIAPNRNIVLVLSGHFHGLGQIRTEDAGGIPGHTVTELVADYQEYRTHTGERGDGLPAAAADRSLGGRHRGRHVLAAARHPVRVRLRLPAVRRRQRLRVHAVERAAVAGRRVGAAGSLRRRRRRVHRAGGLPVREVGRDARGRRERPGAGGGVTGAVVGVAAPALTRSAPTSEPDRPVDEPVGDDVVGRDAGRHRQLDLAPLRDRVLEEAAHAAHLEVADRVVAPVAREALGAQLGERVLDGGRVVAGVADLGRELDEQLVHVVRGLEVVDERALQQRDERVQAVARAHEGVRFGREHAGIPRVAEVVDHVPPGGVRDLGLLEQVGVDEGIARLRAQPARLDERRHGQLDVDVGARLDLFGGDPAHPDRVARERVARHRGDRHERGAVGRRGAAETLDVAQVRVHLGIPVEQPRVAGERGEDPDGGRAAGVEDRDVGVDGAEQDRRVVLQERVDAHAVERIAEEDRERHPGLLAVHDEGSAHLAVTDLDGVGVEQRVEEPPLHARQVVGVDADVDRAARAHEVDRGVDRRRRAGGEGQHEQEGRRPGESAHESSQPHVSQRPVTPRRRLDGCPPSPSESRCSAAIPRPRRRRRGVPRPTS